MFFFFPQCLILTLFLKSQSFGSLCALSLTGLLFAVTLQLLLRCCQSSVQLQHPFRVLLKAYQLGNPILCPDQSRQQLHKASKFFHTHSFVFFDVLRTGIALDSENDEIQNSPHSTQNSCQLLLPS